MEKKYYFLGSPSGANEEIKKILQKHDVPFKQVKPDQYGSYYVKNEDAQDLVEAGYKLVCVDAHNLSEYKSEILKRGHPSCLELITLEYSSEETPWQLLVAENDTYSVNQLPYSVFAMSMLIKSGYSRKEINAVRAYDRKAKGISKEEEKQTTEALKSAQSINGLLIVDNLPHNKYQSVLDNAFWMQQYQNIVIFTEDNHFLYYGYADIAFEVMKAGFSQITHWCYNEGHCKTSLHKQRLLQFLKKHAKIKKKQLAF